MIHIENDKIKAVISKHGAELTSLYSKEKQIETLWQADPKFWARHAPILFPNVGRYYKGAFTHKGTKYTEGQHGFARDSEFTCVEHNADSACFRFESKEETLKRYPFKFTLDVIYSLHNNAMFVTWKVKNSGIETMYFTIGGHPAFNIPAIPDTKFTDYWLEFEAKDQLICKVLDESNGCIISDSCQPLALENHLYKLKDGMFDHDALVFDDSQISRVSLLYPDKTPYITMECDGFPNFGIWSKPGAPFVCLEPWMGRTDNVGFEDELKNKPGITAVDAGKEFAITHKIIIG